MDPTYLLPLLQQGTRQPTNAEAGAAGVVVILILFVVFLGSLGFNWLLAWLVGNAAKNKRCSPGDVSLVFWITFFLGPIIGLIILATRKPGMQPYGPQPGRPGGRPGGRPMGPRGGGGPRPGGPRMPGGRRRGPSLPRGTQQQQLNQGYDQQPAYDDGYAAPPPPVAPPQQAAPPGFLFCPRCGQQNGVQRDDCWSCGIGFHPSMKEDVAEEPADAYSNQSGPGEETVKKVQVVGEETVLKEEAPEPTERILKVACNACGKKFSGPEGKIARVSKCPKCAAEPFSFTMI